MNHFLETELTKAIANSEGYVDQINQKADFVRSIVNGTVGPDGEDTVTMLTKLVDSPLVTAYLP